ncbi:Uncharacterized protein dnm_010870 [Desulfonema magnum]|uniref:Uncharacterized protein n=1 Tax=Desulfonema magnum TaxID=45655 RepID=A0A975BGX0_9BACT|nr:Uncharacterized protein dnm_010870 [Desulfonema magnum]
MKLGKTGCKIAHYNGLMGDHNFLKLLYQNMLFSPNVIPEKSDAMRSL